MEDRELLREFESGTYPFNQWTHRAHMRVAYLYLCENSWEIAVKKMREGIKKYNAVNNVKESETSGYHETITQSWLRLIQFMLKRYGRGKNSEDFLEQHPELNQSRVLLFFYFVLKPEFWIRN